MAVGRLLHQQADVLLLDEPTRGVDVGSKAEIYRLMGELAAQGKAVLFVSSYLPELLGVCDRLAVMSRGRLGPARSVGDWTPEQIIARATGVQDAVTSPSSSLTTSATRAALSVAKMVDAPAGRRAFAWRR